MALIDDVKQVLRVDDSESNIEVNDLIESAKLDLKIAGVNAAEDTDPIIKMAITLYCKAHYGYEDVAMSERLERAYISLKQHLSLSTEYAEVVTT